MKYKNDQVSELGKSSDVVAVRREISIEVDSKKQLGKVGASLTTSDRRQKPEEETRLAGKVCG